MKFPLSVQDRRYKLLGKTRPFSYILGTRNTKAYSLLWFDPDKKSRRALRYASNQPTPFEDEQDANSIVPIVSFENGHLNVDKENTSLQWLLHLHKGKGVVFDEVDEEKEAAKENAVFDVETDALIAFKNTSIDQQQHLTRIIFGKDPDTIPLEVMRNKLRAYVRSNPAEFLKYSLDPDMLFDSKVRSFFDKKVLWFKNGQKDVFFNLETNKQRMTVVPLGEDPYKYVASYFKTNEGLEHLKMLEMALDIL